MPTHRAKVLAAGRVLLAMFLLLGPLVAAEWWVRHQGVWLRSRLSGFATAVDLKQMMLRARPRCPEVVTMGSSLTDRALPPDELGKLVAHHQKRAAFDFAGAGMRASSMLQAFHWLRSVRCTPRVLLVEAHPVVLNGAKGGAMHDAPLMDVGTFFEMPDGFMDAREYDHEQLLEVLTYEQLLLMRRRSQIVDQFMADREWDVRFAAPKEKKELERAARERRRSRKKESPLREDGKVRGYKRTTLAGSAYEKERRRRLKMFRDGKFVFAWSEFEARCLLELTRDAQAAGVRVVLHTPPSTEVYRDILARLGALERWNAFRLELGAVNGIEWFDRFEAPYDHALYTDYVHLGRQGADEYTRALVQSLRPRR